MWLAIRLPTEGLLANCNNTEQKRRSPKPKKNCTELIQIFWAAPPEAFFGQDTISLVTNRNTKTLESDRWRGTGIPFRRCMGRVLYRKSDVIGWLESHELVISTSQYKSKEGADHA